jgi:NAD(P)-dependent dehydrogenase (short-subunit alcohol dehydrogenase family)
VPSSNGEHRATAPGIQRFAGKTVIVTGAASELGIGFAAARRIVAEGGRVVLTDLDGDRVHARAESLCVAGDCAIGIEHDVTDEPGWERVVAASVDRYGSVDGLVNNAGIALLSPIETLDTALWRRQIDVNLTSAYFGCRLAIAQMRKQGRGSIVNVSSVAGLVGMRRTAAYAASKGGMRLMTKALAIETAPDGIRVNSVHPGVIATEIQTAVRSQGAEGSDAIAEAIPMRRMGKADEIAGAIAFLLSDDASYITGTELVIDGGLTAQ